MSLSDLEKRTVFCFLEFLQSLKGRDGIDAESIDVGVQCIGDSCGINTSDATQQVSLRMGNGSHSLSHIFDAGCKALGLVTAQLEEKGAQPTSSSSANEEMWQKWILKLEAKGFFAGVTKGTKEYKDRIAKALLKFQQKFGPYTPVTETQDASLTFEEREAQAEKIKLEGNAAMSATDFGKSVELYKKAIELCPNGPKSHIYYANCAAAQTQLGQFEEAIENCEKAIELNPSYVKSYSRLGYAQIQLADYKGAVDSYRRGLEVDSSNAACIEGLAEAEKLLDDEASSSMDATELDDTTASIPRAPQGMPDFSNLASMLGGAGGGAGGLAGLMSNPNLQQMAQSMMQNPAMMQMAQNMMQNPDAMSNMMNMMGSMGGGMPGSGQNPPNRS